MNKITGLLNQFNRPGGRYTYYPFHAKWNNLFTKKDWMALIQREAPEKIDLYIHIPFCHSLCTFCGCNIKVMKSDCDNEMYIRTIKREWDQYSLNSRIDTLYLGGGTPNFFSPDELKQLLSLFTYTDRPLITIEIDPRFITKDDLIAYKNLGIEQLSFGLQDLNEKVLNNVNRATKIEEAIELINFAYSLKFQHINIDFIYGLTFQTEETLESTFNQLNRLNTDSISLYPFARVPWQNNSQKAFGEIKDFSLEEMNQLFSKASETILKNNFSYIGMGFFSKQQNWQARNIMGFNQRSNDYLIGLGVSAISSSPFGHIQNEKIYAKYLQSTKEENPVFFKSHKKSSDENEREDFFKKLILKNQFTTNELDKFIIDNKKSLFLEILQANLLEKNDQIYNITDAGKYFHKTIMQIFDPNF